METIFFRVAFFEEQNKIVCKLFYKGDVVLSSDTLSGVYEFIYTYRLKNPNFRLIVVESNIFIDTDEDEDYRKAV